MRRPSWANLPVFLPRGKVGEAHLTANNAQNFTTTTLAAINGTVSTNNAAAVGATNLAVTGVVTAGRTYKITVTLAPFSTVANDVALAGVATTGTGTLVGPSNLRETLSTASQTYTIAATYVFYCTASGSATFTAQGARGSGTGNVNFGTGSTILVEEAGV